MKIFALVMLLFGSEVIADAVKHEVTEQEKRQGFCSKVGLLYREAADARDENATPQMIYDIMIKRDPEEKYISKLTVKTIVNNVYFDPAFKYAGGVALDEQMYGLCLSGGQPKFKLVE